MKYVLHTISLRTKQECWKRKNCHLCCRRRPLILSIVVIKFCLVKKNVKNWLYKKNRYSLLDIKCQECLLRHICIIRLWVHSVIMSMSAYSSGEIYFLCLHSMHRKGLNAWNLNDELKGVFSTIDWTSRLHYCSYMLEWKKAGA